MARRGAVSGVDLMLVAEMDHCEECGGRLIETRDAWTCRECGIQARPVLTHGLFVMDVDYPGLGLGPGPRRRGQWTLPWFGVVGTYLTYRQLTDKSLSSKWRTTGRRLVRLNGKMTQVANGSLTRYRSLAYHFCKVYDIPSIVYQEVCRRIEMFCSLPKETRSSHGAKVLGALLWVIPRHMGYLHIRPDTVVTWMRARGIRATQRLLYTALINYQGLGIFPLKRVPWPAYLPAVIAAIKGDAPLRDRYYETVRLSYGSFVQRGPYRLGYGWDKYIKAARDLVRRTRVRHKGAPSKTAAYVFYHALRRLDTHARGISPLGPGRGVLVPTDLFASALQSTDCVDLRTGTGIREVYKVLVADNPEERLFPEVE